MKKYTGIYQATKKDGTRYFRAGITYKGKHISLGSFSTDIDANHAYLEAGAILSASPGAASFLPDSYTPEILSFEKCVTLMNFRDHNLYIKNPIYIKNGFFFYYYTQDIVYTFDIDDLFYFASHKLMKRGGHLFVADYGSQLNILNRYGIRSFAVEGRDYYFANKDSHDFRYSNIICINPYFGVTRIHKNGSFLYQAKIHINGNYHIGIYDSAVEAAIAYNKAVDHVKKQGFSRNYVFNYIDGMSPSEYAAIYSACQISEKLQTIKFD